jgi:hypothetical protein
LAGKQKQQSQSWKDRIAFVFHVADFNGELIKQKQANQKGQPVLHNGSVFDQCVVCARRYCLSTSQPAVGFIIYTPFKAFQTGEQGHWLDVKYRVFMICLWQIVIGNL